MTQRRVLRLGGVALLLVAGGLSWWTRVTPPVTEAEARAYLDRIVAAAQREDFAALCRLNGAVTNCRITLDIEGGRESVPTEPPRVTGTTYFPEPDGGVAGRVLVVEGVTRCGKPYRTEVFVFRENRFSFKAINAVYWSNFRFGGGSEATYSPTPPPTCP